jgi:uncharacterized protein YndB with AHSA1/START domain
MEPAMTELPISEHELALTRLIDAPRERLFRAWPEPKLVTQWFAPRPWTTRRVEMDVRPGGSSLVVMRSPEGEEFPTAACFWK